MKRRETDETIEIIGIVPVTRHDAVRKRSCRTARSTCRLRVDSKATFPFLSGSVRSPPEPKPATANLLRRAVRDVDPSLPIISLQTFSQYLDSNLDLWLVRAGAALFSIFGG